MRNRNTFSRRDFMKRSAAIAVAAPTIVSATALGNDKAAAASDRLTVGFIGMGKQSRWHTGTLSGRADVQVMAVCDVDTTRREDAKEKIQKKYVELERKGEGDISAYVDFHELLARKDIDAVVIATPDHWHTIPLIEACKAGKDVYCEKPLTLTIHEAKTAIDAVRKYDRVMQTGSQQRSSKEFRTAVEYVRSGRIGKVKQVLVDVGGPSHWCDLPEEPMEPGLDWDRWLGQAPKRPYNSILSPRGVHKHFPLWRNYSEYGGGGVCDWGAHHLDIAHWGLGFDDSGPFEIVPPAKAEDTHGAVLRYAGGVEITHRDGNGVWFFGDKGKIFVNRGKFQLWIGQEQKAEDPGYCAQMLKELLPPNAIRLYNSADHLGDWLNSMRTRKPPICDVEIGARTATACNLLNLVYFHRKTLKWDPKAEQLVDHTGDPSWLGRDYRAPWKVA